MERLAPIVTTPTRDELRSLVERTAGAGLVISAFIDLDPTRFSTPQSRLSQITSLIGEVSKRTEDDRLTHEQREALRSDIERVRSFLERDLPAEGAAGVAVFCSSRASLFEALTLPRRVDPAIVVHEGVYLEPLASYIAGDRWCVALVNRAVMRVFIGDPDTLEEVREIRDVVHRKHSQGGWSQARYERSVEKDVENHLTRASEDLLLLLEHAGFDHLVVGTLPELWPTVQEAFHPFLLERVRGRIDIDVEHSSIDDVRDGMRVVVDEHRRTCEREALDRLAQELGRGGLAVAGRAETMKALDDKRVDTLLLTQGAMGAARAIELAIGQRARVRVIEDHDDLVPHGGIAALLRF